MLRFIFIVCFLLPLVFFVHGQNIDSSPADEDVFVDTATVFIDDYIKYTPALGGDSVRMSQGRPINGMFKDFYPNGQLKHKGYYSMGRLTSSYSNYFQDGTTERDFILKGNGDIESNLFYTNGKPRYHTVWKKGVIVEYTEFWPNGVPSNLEVFDKDGVRYEKYEKYYSDSTLKFSLIVVDFRKGKYFEKNFFPTGKISEEGNVIFNPSMADYRRVDEWKIYSDSGSPTKVVQYANGVLVHEGSTED